MGGQPRTINIIGDVAGRHKTLLQLLNEMPAADLTILAGDLVDRGDNSYEVLKMYEDGVVGAVVGNHELFLRDYLTKGGVYQRNWYYRQYGKETMGSLEQNGIRTEYENDPSNIRIAELIRNMPSFRVFGDLLITHAPPTAGDWDDNVKDRHGFAWNREDPEGPTILNGVKMTSVFGHNGEMYELRDEQKQLYGMCIDGSRHGTAMGGPILAGLHWPAMTLHKVKQEGRG